MGKTVLGLMHRFNVCINLHSYLQVLGIMGGAGGVWRGSGQRPGRGVGCGALGSEAVVAARYSSQVSALKGHGWWLHTYCNL